MVDSIINQIKAWNCDDIYDLRMLFRRLANSIAARRLETPEMSRSLSDYVDTSSLPSVRFFEEIDMTKYVGFPVWAMDKKGYCLAGKRMDHVVHIVEVAEIHKEQDARAHKPPPQHTRGVKIRLLGRKRDVLSGSERNG